MVQILNLVASGQQRAQLGMLTIQKQQHIGVLITGANAEIPPFTLFTRCNPIPCLYTRGVKILETKYTQTAFLLSIFVGVYGAQHLCLVTHNTRQPGTNVPWPQNKMHVVDNVVSQSVPRHPAISASSTDLQFMINKDCLCLSLMLSVQSCCSGSRQLHHILHKKISLTFSSDIRKYDIKEESHVRACSS